MFTGAVGCDESAGVTVLGVGFILREVSAARIGLRPVPRFGLDRACEALLTLPRFSAAVAAQAALRSAVCSSLSAAWERVERGGGGLFEDSNSCSQHPSLNSLQRCLISRTCGADLLGRLAVIRQGYSSYAI